MLFRIQELSGWSNSFYCVLGAANVTWRQNFELYVSTNTEGANGTLDPQRDIAICVLNGKLWGA